MGEGGAAPCQTDRWCAAPPSHASSKRHDGNRIRVGQAGGPDYTEDNSGLCSDRHNLPGASTAVPISLEAVLPPSDRLCSQSVEIPFVQDCNLFQSLANMDWSLSPSLPEGMQVHRTTAIEFLRHDPCFSSCDAAPVRHELYIDGSASLEHCAWSMIHVHRFADGTRTFVGLLAGNVVLSPEHHQWIGAQNLDNISAELTAVAVAYTYAMSLPLPCCICPDLRFGHDLVRRQVTNKDNLLIARLCAALGRLCHIPIEEVRAHRGDPYNELADRTAKWAGANGLSLGCVDWSHLHGMVSGDLDIDWAWVCNSGPQIQQMLPFVSTVGSLQVQPATDRISCPSMPSTSAQSTMSLLFSFRVATANVQSAREKSSGVGTRSAALTKRFDQQWHKHQLDIIGVQEARTPQGQDVSAHYAIYCSGVDVSGGSAHFGCEIWLRKDAIIAQGEDGASIRLGACKIVVHIADPRWLVLVVSHGSFEFVIVSLHAPCLSTLSSLDDIAAWWTETSRILQPLPLDRCIAFVDANASLGVDASPLVGSHGAEQESAQSLLFHEFLQATQLMVPCTFEHCHQGESHTWKHPKGTMCRRDYVLVALSLQSWAVRSFVLSDFDRARAHVDHLPSVLCLHGCLQGSTGPPKLA